jgi:hypothetical protein
MQHDVTHSTVVTIRKIRTVLSARWGHPAAFSVDLNGQPDRWPAHCLVSTGISGDAEVNATPQDQKTRACFAERSNVSFAIMLAKFCEVKSTLFSKRLPVQLCPR